MNRRRLAIVAMLTLSAARVLAQTPSPRALRVDAIVQNAAGRPVEGLKREDFQVLVDGDARPLSSFASAGGPPPTVAVLIDVTASMYPILGGVAGLPSTLSNGTQPGSLNLAAVHGPGLIAPAVEPFPLTGLQRTDRVYIGAITRRLDLRGPFAGGAPEAMKAWRGLFELPPVEWLGPSPIWDQVLDTARRLDGDGVRAIVLMTDGLASGNLHGRDDAAAQVALAAVSVSVVEQTPVVPDGVVEALRPLGLDPGSGLRQLADWTGGIFVPVDPNSMSSYRHRRDALARVFDHLHHSYVLGVVPPPPDGRPHRIEVRVRNPKLIVLARQMY